MGVKDIVSGKILTNKKFIGYFPVIFLAIILFICYISNRYNIEKTLKEIDKLETEIGYTQKRYYEQKGAYQKQTQMFELEKILSQREIYVSRESQKHVVYY